jgi:hypothetical protein
LILSIISRDASTVRLPAYSFFRPYHLQSVLFARLRPLRSCWTPLLWSISKNIIPAARRLGPCTSLDSSGHVPGALANRPKPCLGCFVYHTGAKPTTSSRARLLGARLQANHHRAYFLRSDFDPPCSCLDFCLFGVSLVSEPDILLLAWECWNLSRCRCAGAHERGLSWRRKRRGVSCRSMRDLVLARA